MEKPKIYCFINGGSSIGYLPVALAQDGTLLAGHCSSSISWAKHDIGIGSDWKHDKYKQHYPDGFELVWLEESELNTNQGFLKAVELNEKMAIEDKSNP